MAAFDWTGWKTRGRWALAAAPAVVAALGVAMSASSTPRPDLDRTAEAVARITEGDLTAKGLAALTARLDPAQLALAVRHDPNSPHAALLGLTPGWESLSLGGKPSLDLGASGLDAQRLNASTPAVNGALRPALPFVFKAASEADRKRALRCLTQGIYYEAALESTEGQEGVAQVILNRVRDPNYPTSICGVVFQGAERTTGCQFSFTCDGALAQAPAGWAWDRARVVAERALSGYVAVKVGTATHYHADYVHPWWSPTLAKITQIGAHIFYRWKGYPGETAAFNQAYAAHEPIIDEARFSRPRVTLAATDAASPEAAAQAFAEGKSVMIDGKRVFASASAVAPASLGGRRAPTPEDIAAINARLKAFEAPAPVVSTVAAGSASMTVEEVGRPAS